MRKFVLAAVLVLMAGGAQAATLDVVGGQLMGASDVLVDGSLYDVDFVDGTCNNLFTGCFDYSYIFTFQSGSEAIDAAQALLDQVFTDSVLGNFDDNPWLTNGCQITGANLNGSCWVHIPFEEYTLFGIAGYFSSAEAENHSEANPPPYCCGDVATVQFGTGQDEDFTFRDDLVYAVWTPIPEPNTALLLGFGLVGLGVKRRQRLAVLH